jgi:Trk-type K+ transport system membrane component
MASVWPPKTSHQENHGSNLSSFSRGRFVYQQLRSQFSHDIWWLSLTILLITVIESDNYKAEPLAFSTFNIIFEVVSAYSCVGVTVGYPGKSYAFCGAWHTLSKLLLIVIALRGRHRGLSVVIDNAALFPKSRDGIRKKLTRQETDKNVNIQETPGGRV